MNPRPSHKLDDAARLEPVRALVDAATAGSVDLADLLSLVLPGLTYGGSDAGRRLGAPMWRAESAPEPVLATSAPADSTVFEVAAVWENRVVFAINSAAQDVSISIDNDPPMPMARVPESSYWFHQSRLATGCTHSFAFFEDGKHVGTGDVAGYTKGSYALPEARRGLLSESRTLRNSIYPDSATTYWVYANCGSDKIQGGAPVMVWNDGETFVGVNDALNHRLQVVSDNLVHRGVIPPMVHILLAPAMPSKPIKTAFEGQSQAAAMRGLQYDTMSDDFPRYLTEEVLPAAARDYELRRDAYSRGVGGASSGGLAAFKTAWLRPQEFSRVHCAIGSFVGLAWDPQRRADGGFMFSNMVRRDDQKNIRVWMSEGMNDIEVDEHARGDIFVAGSWPLNNIQLANALKLRGYDFHFRYGTGYHSHAQAALDLPESLAWLWRGYDPDRTSETYRQEDEERRKPIFRVKIANRDPR